MKAINNIILLIILASTGCSSQNVFTKQIRDKEFKDELIKIAKRIHNRGLNWGTGGDISVRIPGKERFIIKATGSCFADLDYEKIATVGLDGNVYPGSAKPSHETNIHCALYNLYDDVGAIMHIHSTYVTAWATAGKKIPAVTQQSAKLLKNVGLVPYHPPGSQELVDSVFNCYKEQDVYVVLMENHGFFIIGADLYDICYKAEVVENTARIAYLSQTLGEPKKLEYLPSIEYNPGK